MSHKFHKPVHLGKGGPPNSEINVTPLVDVVLVLLIIFMVVTPLLEKDIEVKVPETEKVEDQTDVPPDQVVVSLTATNDILINNEKIADADYETRMKRIMSAKKVDDRLIFFMPDDKANYGKLVTILDQSRKAGADTLGMMTEKPEGMNATPGAPGAPGAPATPGGAPGTAPAPGAPSAPPAGGSAAAGGPG